MLGTGPPSQRASVALTRVAVVVCAPLMVHLIGWVVSCRSPRPCTTAADAVSQYAEADTRQTYVTSSHMTGIHALTTLAVAAACVSWLKKKKGAEAICCTAEALQLLDTATVITRVPFCTAYSWARSMEAMSLPAVVCARREREAGTGRHRQAQAGTHTHTHTHTRNRIARAKKGERARTVRREYLSSMREERASACTRRPART